MHPILLQIGDFRLYSYGTAIVLAALIGGSLAWRWRPVGLFSLNQYLSICLLTTLGATLGARFAAWWMTPRGPNTLEATLRLWEPASLASVGVPVMVFPMLFLYCWHQKLSILAVLDHLFPFTLFGAAFQRTFGCYLAGCCGGPTHGLQLIEGACLFAGFLLLRRTWPWNSGSTSLASLGAYATIQSLIRPWRFDGGGAPVLWFFAALAAACVVVLFVRNRPWRNTMRISWTLLFLLLLTLPGAARSAPPVDVSPEAAAGDVELGKAINAYMAAEYHEARELLRPLAEAGRSEAQYLLGSMYEQGLEVRVDPARAFAWYLRASRLNNQRARKAVERMQPHLRAVQRTRAERLAKEERLVLDREYGCMSFYGEAFQSHYVSLFPPEPRVDRLVDEMLGYTGLDKNFRVHAANVANAAAVVQNTERYLLYNPRFLDAVNQRTRSPWAAYSIMAHEIGHHLQGHTIQPGGSRPEIEIQADKYAGFLLAQMGADLREAQSAIAVISSPVASPTHPARGDRLQAIERGWSEARQRAGGSIPRRQPQMPSPTAPSIPALHCATPRGECPIPFPVEPGSVCYCATPYGTVSGYGK